MMRSLLFLAVLLVSLCSAQDGKDPLRNFCRIHSHQTTVVDRTLYINGGLVNWEPLSADAVNYTNTWFRAGDLDELNVGFPQQHVLTNNDSVPAVQGGILWPDASNKIIYLYGGEYNNGKPEEFRLWFYDIVYNTWNVSNASTTDVSRASWGAGVAVQDRALGYYYGGWLSETSVPDYQGNTPLKDMLVYDMLGNSFRNQSGPDDIPRAEGVMLYLPAGDGGILIYLGGLRGSDTNETMTSQSMTEILIYDIANNHWYTQKASGDRIPEARRRFCAGATWAEDRSSYNIYLYGGASVGEGAGFGDAWILSMPSFRWIKYYPEDDNNDPYPHHSLTCNVVDNAQMIVMGGSFPNHTMDCDVPTIYGQHGLDLGKANSEGAKWARFDPTLTTYKVPSEITTVVGGAATGGATVTSPEEGWAHQDLQVQFKRAYTPAARAATRAVPSPTGNSTASEESAKHRKAVIGGAVGGSIGGVLLLSAIGAFFVIRRNKKKDASKEGYDAAAAMPPKDNMDPAGPNGMSSPPPQYGWAPQTPISPYQTGFPEHYGENRTEPGPGQYHNAVELADTQMPANNEPVEKYGSEVPAPQEMPVNPR
ncbi:hypothetical protein P280DRAFT_511495 [Massarina eburnea CBS 473.64]|uniref:Kelch repeat protein-like protein n=1 Tax=Massarina eburnea CBS 473.64 TaxID=1395130 RepID=A0A6A6RIE2_9PLEO|nr:hypothetical protein P280DRAFT_511495 [Massarina eburnea CBS 473.64]